MKKCTKCGIEKELKDFYKEKKGKYGVRSKCIDCYKKYFDENKDRITKYKKDYYEKNKEKIAEHRKEYYKENKEKVLKYKIKYQRERRQNDPIYRMIDNYRKRTWEAYRNNRKSKSTLELLGCTGIELANHLEKQFQEGMTHDNYGEWHIDHIRPCASFDLSDPKEAEKCFHYTNLQPLWAADNLSKGDSY